MESTVKPQYCAGVISINVLAGQVARRDFTLSILDDAQTRITRVSVKGSRLITIK